MKGNTMSLHDCTAKDGQITTITFRELLTRQIRKAIRTAKQDGTTAMSLDNLKQVTRPPSENLPDAPRGTNAQWLYAEMFKDVCQSDKAIASFLL
jgi:hypothetical protein